MKVTVLGCGGSNGIPVLGRGWGDCDPENPRNRRMRSSVLVEIGGRNILVDTAPEVRIQLLEKGIERLDAVFLTHAHADHIMGLNDLRPLTFAHHDMIPIFGGEQTLTSVQNSFPWLFVGDENYRPCVFPNTVWPGVQEIAGIPVTVFAQPHGPTVETLGLRIGNFAYTPDNSDIPPETLAELEGLDSWIVATTLKTPHPLHSSLSRVLEWVEKLKPRRTFLTHMNRHMDYASLCAELPSGVLPAYDGLVLEVNSS